MVADGDPIRLASVGRPGKFALSKPARLFLNRGSEMSKLIDVVEGATSLTLIRRKEPYLYDLFYGTLWFAFQSCSGPVMYFLFRAHDPKFAYDMLYFGTAVGIASWIPLLCRVAEGLLFRLKLTFDKTHKSISLNGNAWASFHDVASVDLLTCLGPSLYRRFRIEINCSRLKYIMVVDMPIAANWLAPLKYGLRANVDRKRYGMSAIENHRWHNYEQEMGGFSTSDPCIQEVFALYHTLCNTLSLPEVPTPSASGQELT